MKRFLGLLPLSTLIAFSSCYRSHDDNPYPYPYYSPYTVLPDTNRFVAPYTNYNANGYTTFYYPYTSIKSSEGNYEHGVPSGYWKLYYPNGHLLREGNYSNGQLSGEWKFYYPNGLTEEEGNYENDIKSGNWIYYYNTGIKSAEGNYSNGAKEGEWTYYNTDGTVSSTASY